MHHYISWNILLKTPTLCQASNTSNLNPSLQVVSPRGGGPMLLRGWLTDMPSIEEEDEGKVFTTAEH